SHRSPGASLSGSKKYQTWPDSSCFPFTGSCQSIGGKLWTQHDLNGGRRHESLQIGIKTYRDVRKVAALTFRTSLFICKFLLKKVLGRAPKPSLFPFPEADNGTDNRHVDTCFEDRFSGGLHHPLSIYFKLG